MAESKMRETKVEAERLRYRATDKLIERFDKVVEEDGLYSNRSDAIRGLMIEYINKIEGSKKGEWNENG